MNTRNEVLRLVTLCFQALAIFAYFVPTLILGGEMSVFWLTLGVIHSLAFCAMFFRNSRRRRVLSAFLLVAILAWCGLWVSVALVMAGWNASLHMLVVYVAASAIAAIFAMAVPKKVQVASEVPA